MCFIEELIWIKHADRPSIKFYRCQTVLFNIFPVEDINSLQKSPVEVQKSNTKYMGKEALSYYCQLAAQCE